MKPTQSLSLGLSLIILLLSCNQPDYISTNTVSPLYATSAFAVNKKAKMVMVYDLGYRGFDLELKPIAIEKTSEIRMEDLVKAFIENTQFEANLFKVQLGKIDNINDTHKFHFQGLSLFLNKEKTNIFWKALGITLERNFNMSKYIFHYNGIEIIN